MKPYIQFVDVYLAFGKNKVLNGLNLEIRKGETLTILGGSGTGKSVTLKILLGIMRPDRGDVFFKGGRVNKMREKELNEMRKNFGMLFQGAALFDSLTVKENIAYPLREHFDYEEEKLGRIVSEKLALVGLEKVEKMMPGDLSGGMKKRVGLARAIAANPEVILYDEPTTGLDPANTERINNLILEMQKRLEVTSVVVTHDIDSAFQVSNRLALLKEGQIRFVGTPDEAGKSDNRDIREFIGKKGRNSN